VTGSSQVIHTLVLPSQLIHTAGYLSFNLNLLILLDKNVSSNLIFYNL
jgi:hypothetical protein